MNSRKYIIHNKKRDEVYYSPDLVRLQHHQWDTFDTLQKYYNFNCRLDFNEYNFQIVQWIYHWNIY